MTPVVLLLGCNGQLGRALQARLAGLGEVVALDRGQADLAQPDKLRTVVRAVKPMAIVNAAAYTAVDRAESEPGLAHQVNAVAPGVLAEEAAALGALLVHYSTDYVFDGRHGRPYKESDAPAPLSVYGRTKLEGEERVRAAGARHWILRCGWLYAAHGRNFLKTMLSLAQERDTLRVVDDQRGTPTSACRVADVTCTMLERQLRSGPAADAVTGGTYHLAAAGGVSRLDYARFAIELAREQGLPLRLRPDGLQAISSAQLDAPAARPADSRLDCAKLASALSLPLPDWRDDVRKTVRRLCQASGSTDGNGAAS